MSLTEFLGRTAGVLLFIVSLQFLLDALRVPASKFTPGAWIVVGLAGACLYLGATLIV